MTDPTEYLGKRYLSEGGYDVVTGVITTPALILKNPFTGAISVVVIGSRNHEQMQDCSTGVALSRAEGHLLEGHKK
jgi:methylmalonyl-CoA mutase cobalamin-binding subunit